MFQVAEKLLSGDEVAGEGARATNANATPKLRRPRSSAAFQRLAAKLGLTPRITEVDNSSLFCEVIAL